MKKKERRSSHSAAAKARTKRAGLGVYSQEEREIFRYCGGCAKGPKQCPGCRRRDPFAIVDAVCNIPELDVDTDEKLVRTPGIPYKDQHAAYRRLVQAGVAAFDVELYDEKTGRGLTADEVIQTWIQFVAWKEELKKKHDTMPNLPSATECLPSEAPSPSSNTADSISTVLPCAPSASPPSPAPLGSPSVPTPEPISSAP